MYLVRRFRDWKQVLFGVLIGVLLNSVYLSMERPRVFTHRLSLYQRSDSSGDTGRIFPWKTGDGHADEYDHERVGFESERDVNGRVAAYDDSKLHQDDDTVARLLAEKIRIVCIIITAPQHLTSRTVYVRDTWTKRCTKTLFFSSKYNDTIPTIGLNVSEGRDNLTPKHNLAFKYAYDHHFDDGDWFYKADDDTYAIMENMRYLLARYSPSDPIYFGQKFKPYVEQGYPSGGSGYVLSKEAFRRFGEKGLNASLCKQKGSASDVKMGECMEKLGVKLMPTADKQGRTTFHCCGLTAHVLGSHPDWYRKFDPEGYNKTAANMSDFTVSFHYVTGPKMHELEFLIYHLMPYGILRKFPPLPEQN